MSVDAVLLLRRGGPDAAATLRSRGLYVRHLSDGSLLVNTMMSFSDFQRDRVAAALWLLQLGVGGGDPRGVLCIPDSASPTQDSYDAVVDETCSVGFWIVPREIPEEMLRERTDAVTEDIAALTALARRLKTEPNVSLDELLRENWPPIVREQLLHLQRLARKA